MPSTCSVAVALILAWMLSVRAAPPGVVIDHSPASSGLYIGSPSIVILPDGTYLASHDFFGPQSGEFEAPKTLVFSSRTRGRDWERVATLSSLFWAGLFVHRGDAYLMGTDKHHGRIVLRRSHDQGLHWTEAVDAAHGLLTTRADYHTAPTPVIEQQGRLWRGFEDASGGTKWGARYLPMLLSIPVDADLLNAANWTFSETASRDPKWLNGSFNAWLEGNAVRSPGGAVLDILRVDVPSFPEKIALISVEPDGRQLKFEEKRDIVDFPGGAKKFSIRFDPASDAYWSLANAVPAEFQQGGKPSSLRNTLALVKSKDLRGWEIRAILLQIPETKTHAFQYADWQFDGDDIIAAVRTAADDDQAGAHNAHDANYLTFHRFSGFRALRSGK